jgi:prevent-host-death family protein
MSTITADNTIISLRDLARQVSDTFRIAEHNPVVVTRHNKPIARIVPYNTDTQVELEIQDSKLLMYLTRAISDQVVKKYKNKMIPSLAEQLDDL